MALACDRPSAHGAMASAKYKRTWTFDTIHAALRAEHPEVAVSRKSVVRILSDAELRPHRVQGWLHSTAVDAAVVARDPQKALVGISAGHRRGQGGVYAATPHPRRNR